MHDIRDGNCPLCQHHEIVESYQPDWSEGGLEVPSSVTAEPRWIMPGRNPRKQFGRLVIYFCRDCGYAQEFVQAPSKVPIDAEFQTRLIEGVKRAGPYR